MKKLNEV
ncbi:Protein of unknown function [Bacillus mycoides]|nr:Protein of unknown function [Bacillus mycoides]